MDEVRKPGLSRRAVPATDGYVTTPPGEGDIDFPQLFQTVYTK